MCDGKKVAMMAVEYLISLGHTSIGYVGDCYNEARYRGYLEALHRHDIDPEADYIVQTGQTEAEGLRQCRNLCSRRTDRQEYIVQTI